MEKFYVTYSKKNIPLANHSEFRIQLISNVESLIKRMRWKTLQSLGKLESKNKDTFGFRTRNCPPSVEELNDFESDMMALIHNIRFKKVHSESQNMMKRDIATIKESKQIFVLADKSRNVYKVSPTEYKKALSYNITKTYKKSSKKKVNSFNIETKKIAEKYSIDDRIEKLNENQAYITVKD